MAIELVVFDMAGTTVKDRNYVGLAFQQAIKSSGHDVPIAEINPIMGYEKPLAIKMMLDKKGVLDVDGGMVSEIHHEFVKNMLRFYRESEEIEALPGVEQTFTALRGAGVKIALNTGFSRDIADVIIERLGWASRIDMLVASDEVPRGRPYPDMIRKIMAQFGIDSPLSVAKVGDTEVDINEAKNAGCAFAIGVTTGAFTREELEQYQPTHVIDDIAMILEILNIDVEKLAL